MSTDHWITQVAMDFLADEACSYHRSYYPPGEHDDSALVITARRISREDYDKLASGEYDYQPRIVHNETASDAPGRVESVNAYS